MLFHNRPARADMETVIVVEIIQVDLIKFGDQLNPTLPLEASELLEQKKFFEIKVGSKTKRTAKIGVLLVLIPTCIYWMPVH